MARPKKSAAVTAVVSSKRGGALALPSDLLDELTADATEASANVRSFGESNIISTKGGLFSFKGQNLGDTMEAVILTSASVNEYYEGEYDPNVKGNTPACYAVSLNGIDMAPHANSPTPQSSVCKTCLMHEMGSATRGKGRACKEKVRLILLHADDVADAEAVMEAAICQVSVPTMSVSNFGSYVKVLANDARFNKQPTYRFKTKIQLEKHPTYQYVMKFSPLDSIDDAEVLRAIMGRVRNEAKDLALTPFPPPATTQAPGASASAKKKALPTAKPVAATGGRSRFSR